MSRIMARNLYGTVDLLILKTLSVSGPRHGLAILDEIRRNSSDYLLIDDAALYPALHRLQKEGLLTGEWRISDKRRRAKFYKLTPAGRRELKRAVAAWKQHTVAVCQVLEIAWGEQS
jgi:transcriptional regulator